MESSSLHLAMQPRHPPSSLLLCSEAKSSAKISANSRANPQSVSRSARPDDWPQQHSGVLARPCQTSGFASLRRRTSNQALGSAQSVCHTACPARSAAAHSGVPAKPCQSSSFGCQMHAESPRLPAPGRLQGQVGTSAEWRPDLPASQRPTWPPKPARLRRSAWHFVPGTSPTQKGGPR